MLKHYRIMSKLKLKPISAGSCHLSYVCQDRKEPPAEFCSSGTATPVAVQLWGPTVKHKGAHLMSALSQGSDIWAFSHSAAANVNHCLPSLANKQPQQPVTGVTSKCVLLYRSVLTSARNHKITRRTGSLQTAHSIEQPYGRAAFSTIALERHGDLFISNNCQKSPITLKLVLSYARLVFRLRRTQRLLFSPVKTNVLVCALPKYFSVFSVVPYSIFIFLLNCNINLSRPQSKVPPLQIQAEISKDKNQIFWINCMLSQFLF